jgi:hypothetical protein
MHKKLEAELVSLAHRILQMKNRHEAGALLDKARDVYEKLAVLAFVDDYIATTPNLDITKEELIQKIEATTASKMSQTVKEAIPELVKEVPVKQDNKVEEIKENKQSSDKEHNIFEPKFDSVKIDIGSLKSNQISSKEEFRDTISADKTSTLFDDDNLSKKENKTLNDKLFKNKIQVGLNDRIAFVNHLFNYNQGDFNQMLSDLNIIKTEKEAKDFILNKVKPKYDWRGKETYEDRLIAIIERKFT